MGETRAKQNSFFLLEVFPLIMKLHQEASFTCTDGYNAFQEPRRTLKLTTNSTFSSIRNLKMCVLARQASQLFSKQVSLFLVK